MIKIDHKYNFYLLIFLFNLNLCILGQDPEFSQFFSNKLYLNPAFAGASENAGLGIHFRDQRIHSSSIMNTINLSFNQYVEPIKGGVGIQILNDVQGSSISKLQIDGIYSYHFQVSNQLYINAAIEASIFQKRISFSNFSLPEGIDPIEETISNYNYNKNYPIQFDFSSGFTANYKSSYFGFAIHHLTKPNEHLTKFSFSYNADDDEYRVKRKYTLHYGTIIKIFKNGLIKEKYAISPNIVYQIQNSHRINYGLYFLYQNVSFGMWIKQAIPFNFDAAIFLVGFELPGYEFAYSYDFKLPKSGAFLNINTHEVTFIINFQYKQKKKIKAIKCPKF